MPLTRDDVVDAAVRLLGEVGLEGLTLRRLATDLGVSAPTLYWHVTDKRSLLDHVAERLLADQWRAPGPREDQPWWEWLRERSLAQYRALIDHRDAALVVAGNRPTPDALPAVERTIGTLVEAGFAVEDAFAGMLAIGNLIIGSAVEYHAERARPATWESGEPPDPSTMPHLAAMSRLLRDRSGVAHDHDALFRHALDLMITGLRAELQSRGRCTGL